MESTYKQRFQEAKSLFQKELYQDALPLFESLVKDFPDKAELLSYCGLCAASMSDHVYAIGYLLKATELEPENEEHHLNLGLSLDANGQKNSAINELKKALDINPRLLEAHF